MYAAFSIPLLRCTNRGGVRSEELGVRSWCTPKPPLCKGRCPSAHTGAEGLTLINPLRLADVIAKVAEGHLWQSVLLRRGGDAQNKGGVSGMYVRSVSDSAVLRCANRGVGDKDKLEFGGFSTHAVILSEARSAKSKDLRIYLLHGTNQVRRSFDALALAQDDNRCTNSNLASCPPTLSS